MVLAGGSNVVIADAGVPGPVVLIRSRGVEVHRAAADHVLVRVAAGEPWDEFVAAAVDAGWSGVECLSGIPGSAGATPIQNVGAYGQEVAETIVERRGLRPGRRHGPPDGTGRVPLRLPDQHLQAQRPLGRALRRLPAGPPTRGRHRCATRSWPGRSAGGAGRPGAAGRGPGRGARAARRQGHGARPGRPRHLVGRFVLHQPGARRRRLRVPARPAPVASANRRRGPAPAGWSRSAPPG